MTKTQLEIGADLVKLIEKTEKGLNDLNDWISNSLEKNVGGHYKNDYNYNLCISKHRDGSGNCVDLARYFGNTKILEVIQKELESQLKEYKEDLEKL